uniref:Ig-like domain-containing protein n=1 Tax=Hucho hucho TaxID=62062 RepID=A0A4W5K0S3_9TELE
MSLWSLVVMVMFIHSKLDQSPSQVKKPGDAVKLSCTISGFDMTDYYMHWIRQQPGKRLEWIGRMSTGSNSATYSDSLKDQFIMTEDVSTSTQFLEAMSLRSEDSANDALCLTWMSLKISVLFFSSHYSFSKFPTVSLLSAPIGTTQYLMCSIEDLAPNKVTVTGKQNDMQVEGLTHTVGKQPSGLYSASSLLKVTNTDWNNKVKYSCVVQHTEQTITKTISKTGLYIGEDCTIIYVMLTYRISII